jgi:hypothetical protein
MAWGDVATDTDNGEIFHLSFFRSKSAVNLM